MVRKKCAFCHFMNQNSETVMADLEMLGGWLLGRPLIDIEICIFKWAS